MGGSGCERVSAPGSESMPLAMMHMQDSCTLALLCSGPPVGVVRSNLRWLWKGKLPLECPDARRRRRRRRMRSTATEPEVAARDKPPEVPPCKD